MSRIIKRMRNLIKKIDLFPATQFVKYKQESDYKTATGGCVSITVIVAFLVLFYNLGIKTINQDIIFASVNYQIQLEPPYMNVQINKSPDFLFAIGILGINLNDPNLKFFDISLKQIYQNPSFQIINSTDIPLVQCSKDHFSANPQIQLIYNKFRVENALCPQIGSSFVVGGRLTSDVYAQIAVSINYCNQTLDPKCVNPIIFQGIQQKLGGFTLFVPVVSTIVNPGEKIYKQVFVQDQNFFFFSSKSGIRVNGQIQQYQIDTDISLLPFTDIETQNIAALPGVLTAKSRAVIGNQYASVNFDRSSVQTTYSRSFNKIDSYFSYVGGLVGTVLILFFIMNSYSEMSFSIDIANELFAITAKEDVVQPPFNFIYYLGCSIQNWFSSFVCIKDWKETTIFKEAAEQMDKQLDITHILKRIYYIEEGLQALLTNSQLQTLYLKRKKNIQDIAKMRKKLQYNFVLQEKQQQMSPQGKCRDSSIVHIADANQSESKQQIRIQQQPQYYRIDIDNCQQISQSINEEGSQMQQQKQKMKNCLNQVIKDSKDNNQISIRILQKIDPKIIPTAQRNNQE